MNGTDVLDQSNDKKHQARPSSTQPTDLDFFESSKKVPEGKGSGTARSIRLLNGISANIIDASFLKSRSDRLECDKAVFGIGFTLSGRTTGKISASKDELVIKRGESAIYYLPSKSGVYITEAGERSQRIYIEMEPQTFFPFIKDWKDMMPLKLCNAMEGASPEVHRYCDSITPGMQVVLRQIYNCPYQGSTRRFFLEGKIMELIACKLDQLKPSKYRTGNPSSPKADDVERIHYAKEILAANLQNPPSITDLSKTVGLSRTKLYQDFCKIHGEPPSDFLRNKRLEVAGALIREGKYNVTETAFSVGYSSLSHFTGAFRQYHGIVPSRYRQIMDNKG